jgi:erythromycin esterase-like protein
VAVEADWPDAYRVNRWVRGTAQEPGPEAALGDFTRFPRWMWRNTDVVAFVDWLRQHNAARPLEQRVGFCGLDLYSMRSSMEAVLGYLKKVDPEAAERARYRYSCFDHFGENPQSYGYAASFSLSSPCEDEGGVIYRPESERQSHYFRAHLAEQFDAVIHVDETSALEPLEPWASHEADAPETFPFGV